MSCTVISGTIGKVGNILFDSGSDTVDFRETLGACKHCICETPITFIFYRTAERGLRLPNIQWVVVAASWLAYSSALYALAAMRTT